MSYLDLPSLDLSNTAKGTLSLWFRVSSDAVGAAAQYGSTYRPLHPEAPDIFRSTIPLVTFGRKVEAKVYDSKSVTFTGPRLPNSTAPPPTQTVTQVYEVGGQFFCEPSHIGIVCGGTTPALVMKFQTQTRAGVQGLNGQITSVTWTLAATAGSQTFLEMHQTIVDVSYVQVAEPESFLIIPTFGVNVDQWHHLLVSFDLSTNVNVVAFEGNVATEEQLRANTIKSFCKVWYAFDDENKTGRNNIGNNIFGQFPSGWVAGNANGIIPQNAEAAVRTYTRPVPALDSQGNPLDNNQVAASPEYHWTASPLPTQDGPMGFPASAEYVGTIYHCEQAEFQFFSGVVLDTGKVDSRRLFIDKDGRPVPPKVAEEILGRPDVLLHGASNWKKGRNTGSTGIDTEGKLIPRGQFDPVSNIVRFTPEPALGN